MQAHKHCKLINKVQSRRNGNSFNVQSRRNGSRRNGNRRNGSRGNGSRRNGTKSCSHWGGHPNQTMLASVEINNSTATVSGNFHLVLQHAQTSCLGLSVEIINNELWHLEGVNTISTPDRV